MSEPKKTITIILENCTAMRVIPSGYRIVAKDVKTGERFEMGGTPGKKPEFTKLTAGKKGKPPIRFNKLNPGNSMSVALESYAKKWDKTNRPIKKTVCDLDGQCS